jgi:hypothetical protein
MIFQGYLKKTPVNKTQIKTPKVAPMLHLNYWIKMSTRIRNLKKMVLFVKVF